MNPYIRAAQKMPAIKSEAVAALKVRLQEQPLQIMRARNADGTFRTDDPSTPDVNEAWLT